MATLAPVRSADISRVDGSYRVDISRGRNIGRVSSEWFSRPDDEKYLSLTDLYASVRGRAERARTRVVESAGIRVEARGHNREELALILPDTAGPVAPTNWSFGQLCSLVGAPASYLRQLPAVLAGINMQHGLLHHRAEQVKLLQTDDGRTELRAVTGPDYGRIWDHELVAAVMNIAGNGTGDTRWKVPGVLDWGTMHYNPHVDVSRETTTLYVSDRDVFLFLVDDTHPIEAGIDHDILLGLLRRRIDDKRLIRLIGRMLKAGYLEDWTFHRTFSGAPQGGVISPILANIDLHELDGFMADMKARFDKGQQRRRSDAYLEASKRIQIRRRMIEWRRPNGQEGEIPTLVEEIKEWERRRLEEPASDPFDPNYRRLRYCRYADDFVIGVIGSKDDARGIMAEVRAYLAETLRLEVSEEKSGIRKADEGAMFLDYQLKTYGDGRTKRMVKGGRAVTMRVADDRMQLHVPVHRLARFAERQRLGNIHINRGEARCELINNSDVAILTGYNAMMRGLTEYYKLGMLWKNEVGRLHHLWWWSFMKTISRKHKCSVKVTAQRLRNGDRLGLWYEGRQQRRFMPMFRLKDVLLCRLGRDAILIVGVYTSIGCYLSAADAFMRDVRAFLVADGTADMSDADHEHGLAMAARTCAGIVTSAEVLRATGALSLGCGEP